MAETILIEHAFKNAIQTIAVGKIHGEPELILKINPKLLQKALGIIEKMECKDEIYLVKGKHETARNFPLLILKPTLNSEIGVAVVGLVDDESGD